MVSSLQAVESPLISLDKYHPAISFELHLPKVNRTLKNYSAVNYSYDYSKGNFPLLYHLLRNNEWNMIDEATDIDTTLENFYSEIFRVFDICIPKKIFRRKKYPPWFTKDIIAVIRRKLFHRKRFRLYGSLDDLREFRSLRTKAKSKIHLSYSNFVSTTESQVANNPRALWKFLRAKRKGSSYPKLVHYNDEVSEGTQNIANAFAKFFCSVYLTDDDGIDTSLFDIPTIANSYLCTDSFVVTKVEHQEIFEVIKKLRSSKSTGPDNVPIYIIKACAESFCDPLCKLFNKSLNLGIFPSMWKNSRVVPVHKKGDRTNVENYRPISIVCAFAKVFESVIYARLYQHFQNVLSPRQHGFVSRRSTVTNLLHFVDEISLALDNGSQVDTIYTDFSKAFDKVSFPVLLKKLSLLGCTDNMLDWFHSYLTNRTQSVILQNCKSAQYINSSGVPQGSNLGPLLFLIFVNDLPCFVKHSKCLMYADDLKLFLTINSPHDSVLLQEDLDSVLRWCNMNCLRLNVDKCNYMLFSRKRNPAIHSYFIAGNQMKMINTVCDLGITFDTQLTFSEHVQVTAQQAYRNLGFLLRQASLFKNCDTLVKLYESLVRPKLEYGAVLWDPYSKTQILEIEKVQKRFLRFIYFKMNNEYIRDLPSRIMLEALHMSSLEDRRHCHRLLFLYKLLNNRIDDPHLLGKLNLTVPAFGLRSHQPFHVDRARTNVRSMSPLVRMAKSYNKLANTLDVNRMTFCEYRKHCNIAVPNLSYPR